MFGTSYSGFNSLQVACERPPALKAVCAIYATDDRWTDDVHWRGGALRLVDLVDYCHYMTPMNALPPVPAVWPADAGQDWREEWLRRLDTSEPWVLTWLRENRRRRLLAARVGASGPRPDRRLRADRVPGDDRGRLGRRLPQQLVPHRRGARRARRAAPAARRALGARRPGEPRCRAADRPRPRDGRLVDRWLRRQCGRRAPRRGRRLRAQLDAPGPRPRPARGPVGAHSVAFARHRAGRSAASGRGPAHPRGRTPRSARAPGSTAPATCPGASPTTSASTTPAR